MLMVKGAVMKVTAVVAEMLVTLVPEVEEASIVEVTAEIGSVFAAMEAVLTSMVLLSAVEIRPLILVIKVTEVMLSVQAAAELSMVMAWEMKTDLEGADVKVTAVVSEMLVTVVMTLVPAVAKTGDFHQVLI